MFAFAFVTGVKKGWLDAKTYGPAARKAWLGLVKHIDQDGNVSVASFPRPGGNVTGFTNIESTMTGKWLELLKEVAPRVDRVALLFNPATSPFEYFLTPFKAAAPLLGVQPIATPVRDTAA